MEIKYKPKIKFEDIMFWIVITGMIGIALWMLSGSPTEVGAIVGIITFAAVSDMLIWRKVFSIDKNTTIGFMKVKHSMEKNHLEIINKLDNMNKN